MTDLEHLITSFAEGLDPGARSGLADVLTAIAAGLAAEAGPADDDSEVEGFGGPSGLSFGPSNFDLSTPTSRPSGPRRDATTNVLKSIHQAQMTIVANLK